MGEVNQCSSEVLTFHCFCFTDETSSRVKPSGEYVCSRGSKKFEHAVVSPLQKASVVLNGCDCGCKFSEPMFVLSRASCSMQVRYLARVREGCQRISKQFRKGHIDCLLVSKSQA